MPVALITGASSGIGATFAQALSARGYDTILVARRSGELAQVAAKLKTRTEILVADLTADADLARVASACEGIDLLVNNAGFGTRGLFHRVDFASQHAMHKLHVMAAMQLTHAALPAMVARNSGGIINVSSIAAFITGPGNTSYCATKAWMNMFTEGIDLELKSLGSAVKVQALCPGFTYSGFHDVMGMGRNSISKSLWMSSEFVVDTSLRGLDAGHALVVPGWRYKVFVAILPFIPRSLRQLMATPSAQRTKRTQYSPHRRRPRFSAQWRPSVRHSRSN